MTLSLSSSWKCQLCLFFLYSFSSSLVKKDLLIFTFSFSLFLLLLFSGLYQLSLQLVKWISALFSWQSSCLPIFYPTSRVTVLMCKFDCSLRRLKSSVIVWIIYLIEPIFLSIIHVFKDFYCLFLQIPFPALSPIHDPLVLMKSNFCHTNAMLFLCVFAHIVSFAILNPSYLSRLNAS